MIYSYSISMRCFFFPFLPNFVEMPSLFLQKFNTIWPRNTRQANRISVLFNSTLLLSSWTNRSFKRLKTNFPYRNVLPFDIFRYSLKPPLKRRNIIFTGGNYLLFENSISFGSATNAGMFSLLPKKKNDFTK